MSMQFYDPKGKGWCFPAWVFLHAVVDDYPMEPTSTDRANMQAFFDSLGTILPCGTCRSHFLEELRKYPLQLQSHTSLTRWFSDLHNRVNARLGKSEYTYADSVAHQEKLRHVDWNGLYTHYAQPPPKPCPPVTTLSTPPPTAAPFVLVALIIVCAIASSSTP